MIRVAVAEDELNTSEKILCYLERYAAEKQLEIKTVHFCNGFEITDKYCPEYDIILMDVDMPLINGIDAARMIRQMDPSVIIIFITNLSQYAIQGYSVQAFDYILKPLNYFPFSEFFGRAVERVLRLDNTPYYTIRLKDGMRKVAIRDIYYIEINNHTLIYHTSSGIFQTTGKMKEIENELAEHDFSRCNNSYLVNLSHVDSIQENDAVVHGDLLPISRSRKKEFSSALITYISNHLK